MKFLLIIIQIFYATCVLAKVEAVIGTVPIKENGNLSEIDLITNESEILISREQYIISYNKEKRAPNWVAWKLEKNQMGQSGRSNNFEQDIELEKYLVSQSNGFHSVTSEDYKGSCFDRGHQVPSADRTDNEVDNQSTFLMSNMIPQTAHLNRVIWEHLEHYTRELVHTQSKKVYVIAGPIYDEDFGSIGRQNNIKVPSKNFKIIFILDSNQNLSDINANTPMITVVIPNTLSDGTAPTNHEKLCLQSTEVEALIAADMSDWQQYKTTLLNVENLSGLKLNFKAKK